MVRRNYSFCRVNVASVPNPLLSWSRFRRAGIAVFACATAAGVVAGCGGEPNDRFINLFSAPQENLQHIVDRCNAQAGGRYHIILNPSSAETSTRRAELVGRLADADPSMDVLGIDVAWTAELAQAEWILPWLGDQRTQAETGVLAAPLRTAGYDGRLYAAPFTTNVQLLWYRDDLMPKPAKTWDKLVAIAEKLAAHDKPHYVGTPEVPGEGLVAWFNSLVATSGGSILSSDGDEAKLGRPATKALAALRKFAGSAAAEPSLSKPKRDPVRLAVQRGDGFAELNWSQTYRSMTVVRPDLAEEFKWAPYPGIDGVGKAPLGGVNLAVSRFSKHPSESFAAALCLRDKQSQLSAAVSDGLPPTIEAVYAEPELIDAMPMHAEVLAALENAAPPVVTPAYSNLAAVTSATLYPPGGIEPEATERLLRDQINDALVSTGELP